MPEREKAAAMQASGKVSNKNMQKNSGVFPDTGMEAANVS